jgi:hypothetical protein
MRLLFRFLSIPLLLTPVLAHADTTYTDGTFNLANYTATPTFASGTTGAASQCATCGNPGQALQFVVGATITDSAYSQGFTANGFTYNPQTQGALGSIAASVDKDVTVDFLTDNFGNTFHPLIEQDGAYFLASIPGTVLNLGASGGTTGYLNFSANGLTAADFLSYDFTTGAFGTANPNFSGDALQFGLAQTTSFTGGSSDGTFTADYDNLNISLQPSVTPNPVPEPSSLMLLASGIAGAASFARRRRAD